MPSVPPHLLLPRNGGSDSIRSTVSIGFTAPFSEGTVVCVGNDGVLRQYGNCNPNDPVLGIVEKLHPPMNMEADVVISGIVNLDALQAGKTYYLANDGTLSEDGVVPVVQGIAKGKGIFTRPHAGADTRAGTPTGATMPLWATDIPIGWLECDGSLLNSKDYPSLFAATFGNHGSIKARTISGSESILVFAHGGKIPPNTDLLMSAHGKVKVMSCDQGLLVVTSEKPFTLLQTASASIQELSPLDPNDFFLPVRSEPPFKWIVKT